MDRARERRIENRGAGSLVPPERSRYRGRKRRARSRRCLGRFALERERLRPTIADCRPFSRWARARGHGSSRAFTRRLVSRRLGSRLQGRNRWSSPAFPTTIGGVRITADSRNGRCTRSILLSRQPVARLRSRRKTAEGLHCRWHAYCDYGFVVLDRGRVLGTRRLHRVCGLMAVSVETEPEFEVGRPYILFRNSQVIRGIYDVAPDAQSFFVTKRTSAPTEVRIIFNWFQELERLAPADN